MPAVDEGWTTIGPNQSQDWFIHGFDDRTAVVYAMVVFGAPAPGVLNPKGDASLFQGRYVRHVDGTWATVITIHNNAFNNPVDVHLIAIEERI
jgi:hypothetical protein